MDSNKLMVPGPIVVQCRTTTVALLLWRSLGRTEHSITPSVQPPYRYDIRKRIEVPL